MAIPEGLAAIGTQAEGLLSIGGRGRLQESAEDRRQMALRREADGQADAHDRLVRVLKQLAGPGDPQLGQVAVGRLSRGLLEGMEEIVGAETGHLGESIQRDLAPNEVWR